MYIPYILANNALFLQIFPLFLLCIFDEKLPMILQFQQVSAGFQSQNKRQYFIPFLQFRIDL